MRRRRKRRRRSDAAERALPQPIGKVGLRGGHLCCSEGFFGDLCLTTRASAVLASVVNTDSPKTALVKQCAGFDATPFALRGVSARTLIEGDGDGTGQASVDGEEVAVVGRR